MISTLENAGGNARTMTELETLAGSYDGECVKLETLIGDLEADLAAVKAKHLRAIKRQAAIVAAREAELHSAVEQSPALFIKPRTATMHGTKFGYTTSEGKLEWNDADQVVANVRKHFPKRFDELVKTEYTPKKDVLRDLPAGELARLGCRIEGAGDIVLLKRVAGDVEKLINKLIEKLVSAMVEKE